VFIGVETGDWKVARTRRLESLRYIISVNALSENAGVNLGSRRHEFTINN
jgi:hypothetical protein